MSLQCSDALLSARRSSAVSMGVHGSLFVHSWRVSSTVTAFPMLQFFTAPTPSNCLPCIVSLCWFIETVVLSSIAFLMF